MTLTGYTAAHDAAAWLDRSSTRGRIVVSGGDRRAYLHGLLTNDIATLGPGTGCYALYLTAQGRMIADMWVYELGDVVLLALHADVTDTILARFDQFIFSEDVQLADVSATFAELAIVGPQAADRLSRLLTGASAETLRAMPEHGNLRGTIGDAPAIVTRIADVGEPGFGIYVGADRRDALVGALEAADVPRLDADAAETLRVEAGVPLFHRDMDEETIPLEAGLEARAISFTKGCYVGQEVIIRVLHRGHGRVARRLVGLAVDGAVVPQRSAVIEAGDKAVGHVTSAAFSPRRQAAIALGYVQREAAEPDTIVRINSASAAGNGSDAISARVTHRIS